MNNKRSYDNNDDRNVRSRYGAGDGTSIGSSNDGGRSPMYATRFILKKSEFAKIIGKGGREITNIRTKTKAYVKGEEIDDEDRMFIVSGTYEQIAGALSIIIDLLHMSYQDYVQQVPHDSYDVIPFAMYLLIEHNRAGKVIGSKGSTILDLQQRTGCVAKMSKDPKNILGSEMRILVLEGHPNTIRNAHEYILGLFLQPSIGGVGVGGGSSLEGGHGSSSGGHRMVESNSVATFTLTSSNLMSLGVPVETVMRVMEAQTSLVPYGIDLVGMPMGGNLPIPGGDLGEYDPFGTGGQMGSLAPVPMGPPPEVGLHIALYDVNTETNEKRLEFFVDKEHAGSVIGKGGSIMKEMEEQFQLRIFMEREHINGLRRVVIRGAPEHTVEQMRDCMNHMCRTADPDRIIPTF